MKKNLKETNNLLEDMLDTIREINNYECEKGYEIDLEKSKLAWILNDCYHWEKDLERMQRDIKSFLEPLNEYRIQGPNKRGRFEIEKLDYEFCCGSFIAIFVDDSKSYDYGWNQGRVEYRHDPSGENEGYYFLNRNGDNYMLRDGMRVAVRK